MLEISKEEQTEVLTETERLNTIEAARSFRNCTLATGLLCNIDSDKHFTLTLILDSEYGCSAFTRYTLRKYASSFFENMTLNANSYHNMGLQSEIVHNKPLQSEKYENTIVLLDEREKFTELSNEKDLLNNLTPKCKLLLKTFETEFNKKSE